MRTLMGALALLAALAPQSGAAPAADAQRAIQANYNDRDGAVSRKDIDGTLAHYAPDFVGVSAKGKAHDLKEERADFLKTFTSLPARSSVTKSTIQKLTLAKAGAEAAVTVRRHGVLLLVNPQTQRNDVLVLDGVYQDTWAKRPAGWLLTREQVSSLRATMNGRPL
jgi:ketosteroid isomerase-like protein